MAARVPDKIKEKIMIMNKKKYTNARISNELGIPVTTVWSIISKQNQTAATSTLKDKVIERVAQHLNKKDESENNFQKLVQENKKRDAKIDGVLAWIQKKYFVALIVVSLLVIFCANWFCMTYLPWGH